MAPPRDARDFEALYDRCAAAVLGYCLRRTTPELAEDAFAETFAVAWRRRDAVPAEPLPWLYGVARKVIANQRRSARRQAAVARRLVETAPAPSASDAPESSRRVVAALAARRMGGAEAGRRCTRLGNHTGSLPSPAPPSEATA